MKRGLLVLLGVLLLVLGLVLIGAGATVAALVGSDDSLSTSPAHVSGQGVALVAEDITIDESNLPVPSSVGTLTLSVTDPGGTTMFVGAATAKDVDTYLTGAPYDVVVDMTSGSTATTRPVPGTQQPKPPASQSFWTSQATGTTAALTSPITRTTTVVIMNADATKQVDADVVVTFTIKHVFTGALVAAGVGVLLVLLSILAFWRARVAGRRKREAAAAAAGVTDSPATVLPGAPLTPAEPVAAGDADATAVLAPVVVAAPAPGAGEVPVEAGSPPLSDTPIADSSFAAPDAAEPSAPAPGLSPPDPVTVAATAFAAAVATTEGAPPSDAEPDAEPATEGAASSDAPAEVAPSVDGDEVAPAAAEGLAVPAWAGSAGPDTLTGEELAAPPQGAAAVDGGFADEAAQAAAVAGDTGAIAPVVVPVAAPAPEAEPEAEPADEPEPSAEPEAQPDQAPASAEASDIGHDTEPFERVDAPLYDELASWFRDDGSDGTDSAQPGR